MGCCTAVVLAGGESRRFGADKLDSAINGATLLDRALEGLPDGIEVIVVGPDRPLQRPVRFVREDPPGGGPAAGMVTGLRAALATEATHILVLPGDAPRAGFTATALLGVLLTSPSAAVVATDLAGFEQPLQLALQRSAAAALVASAGSGGAHGRSARALLNRLDPPAQRWPVPTELHFDIDTPDQLLSWTGRGSPAVAAILAALDDLPPSDRPVFVALDGRSGAGKSTLAASLGLRRPATVVAGDDFYSARPMTLSPSQRARMSDAEVAEALIDWRRLRRLALEPLRRREPVQFEPYDWTADDGRLARRRELPSRDLVVVEGVYSSRPQLADLIDLAVYVEVAEDARSQRLQAPAGDEPDWVSFTERGENYYFEYIRPPETFDLRVHSLSG